MLELVLVAPHGDEILAPETEEMDRLANAMKLAGEEMSVSDEYIIISPHNIRVDTHVGVILTEHYAGEWRYGNVNLTITRRGDRKLAERIYYLAREAGVPVIGVNFGALEGKFSRMPLDWGSLIPLHFLPEREMVLLTPARKIDREHLIRFGEVLGEAVKREKKRVSIIISADHAHTHSKSGPYGHSPVAKDYDMAILKFLKSGDEDIILKMDEKFLEEVKPDSYWQLLILVGIMHVFSLKSEFVEYGVADYFGMAVALMRVRD